MTAFKHRRMSMWRRLLWMSECATAGNELRVVDFLSHFHILRLFFYTQFSYKKKKKMKTFNKEKIFHFHCTCATFNYSHIDKKLKIFSLNWKISHTEMNIHLDFMVKRWNLNPNFMFISPINVVDDDVPFNLINIIQCSEFCQ
jgi:hypothetical protein